MTMKTLKSGSFLAALLALCILQLFILRSETTALDNPHNKNNTVNCADCHIPSPPADWWTDQGKDSTGLCGQCHTGGVVGADAKPHTSPTYGGVVLQCTECHNPHHQRQNRVYKTESYEETGTIDTVSTTQLTVAGTPWTSINWAGYILIPDVRYPTLNYRIASNTANTITIDTGGGDAINTTYIKPGATFAIVYGKLIKEYLRGKEVKFFRKTGANSFADGTPDVGGVDTVVDGVCQVCHTKTKYFSRDGTKVAVGHEAGAATDCKSCHFHTEGFKPGCDTCHGNPPTAASAGGPTGLANSPFVTGSATPGAHNAHVTTLSYGCSNCHNGYTMPVESTVYAGQGDISIGFSNFAVTTGSYTGQSNVSYNNAAGTGTKTCSTVYCHGSTIGTVTDPVWDTAAGTYSCATAPNGACHPASATSPPTLGAHQRHATSGTYAAGTKQGLNLACTDCHGASAGASGHVNGNVSWALNTASSKFSSTPSYRTGATGTTGAVAPSSAYGSCSSVYCHSTVTTDGGTAGVYVNTPLWSGTTTCASCHRNQTATYTGSHQKHATTYSFGCATCHTGAGSETTKHTDLAVDVSISTTYSGTYSGSSTPGDAYSTCATTYCHSNGTSTSVGTIPTNTSAAWGAAGPLACDACHGSPPAYTTDKANSHTAHSSYTCDKCHNETTTDGTSIRTDLSPFRHVNQAYNIAAGTGVTIGSYAPVTPPSTAGGDCSNISCHGGNDATWGGPSLKCSDCHAAASDDDDYVYNNGTTAKVSSTEWGYSGHGKTTGQYDITTNPAANFPGAAGTGDPCLYCHDGSGVAHGDTGNFFRLRNFADATYGKNGVCEACHATGSSGVDPDGGGTVFANKNATNKIDKYHYGSQHSTTLNGGQFCWDCHDPHGDSTSAASGPIAMIHLNPQAASNATTGVPTSITATAVAFTNNANPSDYGKTGAPYNGVCNVCHTEKATNPNKMVHYTSTSSDSHNSGTLCTDCHKHSDNTTYDGDAWKGQGECITCHNTGGAGTIGSRRAIVPEFSLAWSHKRSAGGTVTNNDCAVCHAEAVSASDPSTTALHDNGFVDLRDPDTGNAIANFTEFTRNTANASLETAVVNTQAQLCLKCHDADGASHASAQVPGGSALRPFNTAALNSFNQNVLDVNSQLATTNSTFHPVRGPQNNPFTNVDTMVAPWDTKSTPAANPNEAPTDGPQISCWDCHETLNTAHGGSTTLRGTKTLSYNANIGSAGTAINTTNELCVTCHQANVYAVDDDVADDPSAFGGVNAGGSPYPPNQADVGHGRRMGLDRLGGLCTVCHGSSFLDPGRPFRSGDVHGYDKMVFHRPPLGVNVSLSASGAGWSGPTNVSASDNTYAVYNGTGQSDLVVTNFGFPTSDIPDGVTITGIAVIIEGNGSSADAVQRQMRTALVKGGTVQTAGRKSGIQMPQTTDTTVVFGGPTDLWGTTWTPADIRAGNFGVAISDNDATAAALNIDRIRIAVYTNRWGNTAGAVSGTTNTGERPYGFLRNAADKNATTGNSKWATWRPRKAGATTYNAWGCSWSSSGGATPCSRTDHMNTWISYGPGGVY